jgi:hypothetical protein
MDDYTDFWERPTGWPDDLHGYTFLARAFNRLGQAMYPEWNGSEGPWAVTYRGPTSVMLKAALSRVGDDAAAVAKLKADYVAHEAAYERGIAVQRRLRS